MGGWVGVAGSWLLRLVAVQRAVPRVSSLAVALIGGGGVDAGGEKVAVVEAQSALLHVGAGGVRPDGVLLFVVEVLQLHLHLHGSRRRRRLRLGAGERREGEKRSRRGYVHPFKNVF